jgi:hypothetical protein
MTRERKQPAIRKPLIDEETALRFATAPQPETSTPSGANAGNGGKAGGVTGKGKGEAAVQLTVSLSKEIYARITQEASRKKRSVEELLQRHLTKHYGKD